MNGVSYYPSEIIEYIADNKAVGTFRHQPCLHLKYRQRASGEYQTLSFRGITDHQVGLRIASVLEDCLGSLTAPPPKFVKNNKFDMLPFLVELDDTFAMFSLKFIKNFSYGSFTWGIMPFLYDVRALADSYSDIIRGFDYYGTSRQLCEDTAPLSLEGELEMVNTEPVLFSLDGLSRIESAATATLDGAKESLNRLYFLLDEFGVNPDAAAVWEALPLSFLVDYFVNIGETLESLHPRGWVDWGWTSTGFTSFKGSFEHLVRYETYALPAQASGTIYVRSALREVAVAKQRVELEWQSPSLHQWFNTAYLLTALRRVF